MILGNVLVVLVVLAVMTLGWWLARKPEGAASLAFPNSGRSQAFIAKNMKQLGWLLVLIAATSLVLATAEGLRQFVQWWSQRP